MKSYLLNAPDEDMDAWKKAAQDSGLSLAAWIREHLNRVLLFGNKMSYPTQDPPEDAPSITQIIDQYGARPFRPDPKPTKGKKR